MAVKAYVLISTNANQIKTTLEQIRATAAVQSADAVTGAYDIIATITAESVDEL